MVTFSVFFIHFVSIFVYYVNAKFHISNYILDYKIIKDAISRLSRATTLKDI